MPKHPQILIEKGDRRAALKFESRSFEGATIGYELGD
jgi:hypothetical protein